MPAAGKLSTLFRIWRPTEGEGRFASLATTYADAGRVALAISDVSLRMESTDAGERMEGTAKGTGHRASGTLTRDVLEQLTGADAGAQWRVESVSFPRESDAEHALARVHLNLPEVP